MLQSGIRNDVDNSTTAVTIYVEGPCQPLQKISSLKPIHVRIQVIIPWDKKQNTVRDFPILANFAIVIIF